MHPFGGTPICPRCSKSVYAAEQMMGPGRKLYHKPCLTCTICNKRLDSLTLLEHDQLPYCKTCHIRTFGTRDLRHANLPHRDEVSPASSPFGSASEPLVNASGTGPATPVRTPLSTPFAHNRAYGSADLTSHSMPSMGTRSPVRAQFTGTGGSTPLLRANATLPARFVRISASTPPPESICSESEERSEEAAVETDEDAEPSFVTLEANMSDTERGGDFQFPRTIPVGSSRSTSGTPSIPGGSDDVSVERSASPLKHSSTGVTITSNMSPLKQTSTGTRYGLALGGIGTSPVKSWGLGGATPTCPRCGKNVYFAEQTKAIGKVWHKGCLRCTSCNAFLDSKRLNEKDGEPLCGRCYSKLHGPQGSGYALLGKAGG